MEGETPKEVEFVGRALDELKAFPADAKQCCGYDIHTVQTGGTPVGSKPMPQIGKGAREICVTADDGWFRVFYVAELEGKVWVLHAFRKKSTPTPPKAMKTGIDRYKQAVKEAKGDD